VAALANKKFLRTVTALIRREKQYLYTQLDALGVRFIESATNFIFIDFGQDVSDLCAYLLKNGIIVRDLTDWGFKNFFRVTAGLRIENKKFIALLASYLRHNP
ncbi:MAG: aminotransferase class I/II-fold pyridoxal phosphate-dependent enzyme, partial [Candidatus Omnitrophica bacterium]|nr:aminotransferase class I/II-fold pyridoxal phosphate-dependent enzyme [Candidatus Omnitrophota bacterium]